MNLDYSVKTGILKHFNMKLIYQICNDKHLPCPISEDKVIKYESEGNEWCFLGHDSAL